MDSLRCLDRGLSQPYFRWVPRPALALAALLLLGSPAEARPSGCPHAWCGCWLAMQYGFTGAKARTLWLARNWARLFPHTHLAPGTVAVFARGKRGGHVGRVEGVRPGAVLLTSGNDGRAVRTRWRSTRGLIAAVNPGAMLVPKGAHGRTRNRLSPDPLPHWASAHGVGG